MTKLANQQLEHDGIVNQADDLEMIGNQIIRITEIDQSRQGLGAIGHRHAPVIIFKHQHHALDVHQTGSHIAGQSINAKGVERLLGCVDNIDFVDIPDQIAGTIECAPEALDVGGFKFEGDSHGEVKLVGEE